MRHIHFKTLDSTNAYLKTHYQDLKHMTLITSDEQKEGYGRKHTPWVSTKDSATFSLLLKKDITLEQASLMPLLAAIAVHKVLYHYDHSLTIKWPNDLLYNQKKLAGILCESITYGQDIKALIIGIGININQKSFKSPLTKDATSLTLMTHHTYVIPMIIKKCVIALKDEIKAFKRGSMAYFEYLNHYNALKAKTVTVLVNQLEITGRVKGITFKGHLEVMTPDGLIELSHGSITSIT
ncbi:MAG: biotin--[acetyl-CoA-carboxylase] ligase [Acholeplasmataceae bacterium]